MRKVMRYPALLRFASVQTMSIHVRRDPRGKLTLISRQIGNIKIRSNKVRDKPGRPCTPLPQNTHVPDTLGGASALRVWWNNNPAAFREMKKLVLFLALSLKVTVDQNQPYAIQMLKRFVTHLENHLSLLSLLQFT